jgi:hypothetical protein
LATCYAESTGRNPLKAAHSGRRKPSALLLRPFMDCKDLRQKFFNRERVEGVEYQHNDYVRVIDGEYKGSNGSLISLEAISPEPTFLVELDDGDDVEIRQSELNFISHG